MAHPVAPAQGLQGMWSEESPGKPGLAAEPKDSQPLLAMSGLSHSTFSKTEPRVTRRHSMTRLGDVAASQLPGCVSQGLRNLENEPQRNKQQQAEGLQQSKEQNYSFFKLPGPRGEMMCPSHDKAPMGVCLRTPRFPAFPQWEDLLDRLCHGNATFCFHFFLGFWLSLIGGNEITTVHFPSLCKTLGQPDPALYITALPPPPPLPPPQWPSMDGGRLPLIKCKCCWSL